MFKATYQFQHRPIELACVLQGEHRRDIGIALAAEPERIITVLCIHGPAEMVGEAGLDDETFVSNRIGQAEMIHELDGVLKDVFNPALRPR